MNKFYLESKKDLIMASEENLLRAQSFLTSSETELYDFLQEGGENLPVWKKGVRIEKIRVFESKRKVRDELRFQGIDVIKGIDDLEVDTDGSIAFIGGDLEESDLKEWVEKLSEKIKVIVFRTDSDIGFWNLSDIAHYKYSEKTKPEIKFNSFSTVSVKNLTGDFQEMDLIPQARDFLLSNPHIASDFYRLNYDFFISEFFPWELAFETPNMSKFISTSEKIFSKKIIFEKSPDARIGLLLSFMDEFKRNILKAEGKDRLAIDTIITDLTLPNNPDSRYRDLKYLFERYGDKNPPRRVQLSSCREKIIRYFDQIQDRMPYTDKNGLRSAIHWGQNKLLMSEIEFLTDHSQGYDLVIYAGAAPGTHTNYLSKLFPKVTFLLIDPSDFNITPTDKVHALHKTYFSDPFSKAFNKDVKYKSDEFKDFIKGAKFMYQKMLDELKSEGKKKLDILDREIDDWKSGKPRKLLSHLLYKILPGKKEEDLESWLDVFIPSGNFPGIERKQQGIKNKACRIYIPFWEKSENIKEKIEECLNFKFREVESMIEGNIESIKACKKGVEKNNGNILFISDIRSVDYNKVSSQDVESYVFNDQENQQRWIQMMNPDKSMLKFRLPYGNGKTSYLDGKTYLPVFGRPTTTECRLVPHDNKTKKMWDNGEYEEKMCYFNNRIRVSCHKHLLSDIYPYDCCYDCASEVKILTSYLEKYRDIKNEDNLKKAILEMRSEMDSKISNSGERNIRVAYKSGGFKSTYHTTNVSNFVTQNAYENVEEEKEEKTGFVHFLVSYRKGDFPYYAYWRSRKNLTESIKSIEKSAENGNVLVDFFTERLRLKKSGLLENKWRTSLTLKDSRKKFNEKYENNCLRFSDLFPILEEYKPKSLLEINPYSGDLLLASYLVEAKLSILLDVEAKDDFESLKEFLSSSCSFIDSKNLEPAEMVIVWDFKSMTYIQHSTKWILIYKGGMPKNWSGIVSKSILKILDTDKCVLYQRKE